MVTSLAFALTIGPAQTKRDRAQHSFTGSTSQALYEKIHETYLREDFAAVEGLSAQFLSGRPDREKRQEVEGMRSRAQLKLAQLNTPHPGSSHASVLRPTPALSVRPLAQMGLEEKALYGVQVGSFSKQLNAERLLNHLLDLRYDAYLNKVNARLIRVRVGHLASRDEAAQLESRLKKDGYPTKIFP